MQTRNANDRIVKWIAKFSGERQGVTALLSKVTATYQIKAVFNTQVADETKIKLILAEAGTPRMLNPFYINFGREIRGFINQGIKGGQLLNVVNIAMNKYVARQLDQDTLEKIRNTCFTYGAPAP